MKRIALFSITYHPFIGGAEIAVKEITGRLPGYEFDLFTARLRPDLPAEEKIGRVNVYRLGSGRTLDKWLYPFRASRLARKFHRQGRAYNIAHAVLETYAGLAALLFKKQEPGVPYVLTLQSGDSDLFIWLRTWFWYPLYRQVYARADKVIAISQWLANRARRWGAKGNIDIIPNGVDVNNFSGEMAVGDREFICKSWEFANEDFILITASRLVKKNGVDIIIDALCSLPNSVKLVIAGSGEDEEELKLRVASCELRNRVIFLGYIDHSGLPRVLKSADVFVRPSRTEGLGNAFLEAMAAGLPAVGTRVGGIVDFIADRETGMLVPPNDPGALARAVKELLDNRELRQKIARAGMELAKSKYDWENIALAYKNVYDGKI